MSDKTNIPYAHSTFNPWIGCTEVSDGCKHCYARELALRFKKAGWGKSAPRVSTKDWSGPVKWNRIVGEQQRIWDMKTQLGNVPRPTHRVLCGSIMDWLDERAPLETFCDLLWLIRDTPNLTWLLLTKRPENFGLRLGDAARVFWKDGSERFGLTLADWLIGKPMPNVWLGVSVENQEWADKRIPKLIKMPSVLHFVSCEPMLGPMTLRPYIGVEPKISWIVCGGESGRYHRTIEISWLHSIAVQCQEYGASFFCKQDSHQLPGKQGRIPDELWERKEIPQ